MVFMGAAWCRRLSFSIWKLLMNVLFPGMILVRRKHLEFALEDKGKFKESLVVVWVVKLSRAGDL